MHTPDWRQCVAEACRVARSRVIVDYPSARSVAALQAAGRHLAHRLGAQTEPYRVFTDRQIRDEFARHGFRITREHRQFVLPIAVHKRLGLARRHRPASKARWRRSACCSWPARRSRSWRNGDGPRHRRDRIHRRSPGASPGGARRHGARARARSRARRPTSQRPASQVVAGDLARRETLPAARRRRRRRLQHRGAVSAGRTARGDLPRGERRGRRAGSSRRPPRPACGGSSTAARSACTATSSTRRPTRTRRSRPGDIYQVTKLEGERLAREAAAATGVELVDRPSVGHLRARRPAAAEAVSRRGPPAIRDPRRRQDLLPSDAHRRSGRGLPAGRRPCRRRQAGPTSSREAR